MCSSSNPIFRGIARTLHDTRYALWTILFMISISLSICAARLSVWTLRPLPLLVLAQLPHAHVTPPAILCSYLVHQSLHLSLRCILFPSNPSAEPLFLLVSFHQRPCSPLNLSSRLGIVEQDRSHSSNLVLVLLACLRADTNHEAQLQYFFES